MQRSTKESQAKATVDPRWPFQLADDRFLEKYKDEKADKDQEESGGAEHTMKNKKKESIDEFVRKLKDTFEPVEERWPPYTNVLKTGGSDKSATRNMEPRNADGEDGARLLLGEAGQVHKGSRCADAAP